MGNTLRSPIVVHVDHANPSATNVIPGFVAANAYRLDYTLQKDACTVADLLALMNQYRAAPIARVHRASDGAALPLDARLAAGDRVHVRSA